MRASKHLVGRIRYVVLKHDIIRLQGIDKFLQTDLIQLFCQRFPPQEIGTFQLPF
jgi:hypothetical protein